jgi:hypothetical protein
MCELASSFSIDQAVFGGRRFSESESADEELSQSRDCDWQNNVNRADRVCILSKYVRTRPEYAKLNCPIQNCAEILRDGVYHENRFREQIWREKTEKRGNVDHHVIEVVHPLVAEGNRMLIDPAELNGRPRGTRLPLDAGAPHNIESAIAKEIAAIGN